MSPKLNLAECEELAILSTNDLWTARRERARRWLLAGGDLRGYPALHADEETEATLAAAPAEKAEKKPKAQAAAPE